MKLKYLFCYINYVLVGFVVSFIKKNKNEKCKYLTKVKIALKDAGKTDIFMWSEKWYFYKGISATSEKCQFKAVSVWYKNYKSFEGLLEVLNISYLGFLKYDWNLNSFYYITSFIKFLC